MKTQKWDTDKKSPLNEGLMSGESKGKHRGAKLPESGYRKDLDQKDRKTKHKKKRKY